MGVEGLDDIVALPAALLYTARTRASLRTNERPVERFGQTKTLFSQYPYLPIHQKFLVWETQLRKEKRREPVIFQPNPAPSSLYLVPHNS